MLLNLILSNLSIVISSQDYRYIYYTHIRRYISKDSLPKCDLQVHDTPKT